MQLKPEALNALKLPIKVKAGFLGSVKLKVPWSRLGQEPVVVELDRIFVLAEPSTNVEGGDADSVQEAKNKRVQDEEEKLARGITDSIKKPDDGNNSSWLGSLIGTVIGNLKLSITNIHIRYEDEESNFGHPFAAGLTLAKLAAVTVDENGKETFVTGGALDRVQKSGELNRLSFYFDTDSKPWPMDKPWEELVPQQWSKVFQPGIKEEPSAYKGEKHAWIKDHNYVLEPVGGVARYFKLGQKDKRDPDKPAQKATAILDDVTISLTETQYRDALKLAENISTFSTRVQYAHFRPNASIKEDRKAWWVYAYTALSEDQKKARGHISWQKVLSYSRMRKQYVSKYIEALQANPKSISVNDNKDIKELDRQLDSDIIIQWRMLAHTYVDQERKKGEEERQAKSSWWSFGWGGGGDGDGNNKEFTDDDWKRVNEIIGYHEGKPSPMAPGEDQPNMLHTLVEVQMKHNGTKLVSASGETILELSAEGLGCAIKLYSETQIFDVGLNSYKISTPEGLLGESAYKEKSLYGTFTLSPWDKELDWALEAKAAPCYVTVRMKSINRITQFFSSKEAVSRDVALQTAAALQSTVNEVSKNAQQQLNDALKNKPKFFLDLDIAAPKVTIPTDFYPDGQHQCKMFLDLGYFSIKTLPTDGSIDDSSEEKQLYMRFQIGLKDISAFLADGDFDWRKQYNVNSATGKLQDVNSRRQLKGSDTSGNFEGKEGGASDNVQEVDDVSSEGHSQQTNKKEVESGEGDLYILPMLEKTGMAVSLEQICVPHPNYPTTRIAVRLQSVGFQFSPARYHRIMQVVEVFSGGSDEEATQSAFRPWDSPDFDGPMSVLSWKGVGHREAKWESRYGKLAGPFLYLMESENSRSYKTYHSLIGKKVFNVPPESLDGVENVVAICDAGQLDNKIAESAGALLLRFNDEDARNDWQGRFSGAIYRASAPGAVLGLQGGKGEKSDQEEDKALESTEVDETKLAQQETLFLTGVLDELKIVISNSLDIDYTSTKLLLAPESPLLELRAIGTKVQFVMRKNDMLVGAVLQALEIEDKFHGHVSPSCRFLARSYIKKDRNGKRDDDGRAISSSSHHSDRKKHEGGKNGDLKQNSGNNSSNSSSSHSKLERYGTSGDERFFDANDESGYESTSSTFSSHRHGSSSDAAAKFYDAEDDQNAPPTFKREVGLLPGTASPEPNKHESDVTDNEELKSFVKAQVIITSPESPTYASIDKEVRVTLSTLSFYCNRPTVVAALNLVTAITADVQPKKDEDGKDNEQDEQEETKDKDRKGKNEMGEEADKEKGSDKKDSASTSAMADGVVTTINPKVVDDVDEHGNPKIAYEKKDSVVKGLLGKGKDRVVFMLVLDMELAEIVLNKEDGSLLSTLSQDNFHTDVKIYPASYGVKATLGNLRISDDNAMDYHHEGIPYEFICDMRDPGGSSFIELEFVSYNEDDLDYEGYEFSVTGKLSEVRLVFLNRFIQELTAYFMGLVPQSSGYMMKLKDRASDYEKLFSQSEIQGQPSIKLDISLSKPVIIMPRGTHSKDFMELDILHINIRSSSEWFGGGKEQLGAIRLETITLDIEDVSLTVGVGGEVGLEIFDRARGIGLVVRRPLRDLWHKIPLIEATVMIKELRASLSDKEYQVITECVTQNMAETPDTFPSLYDNSPQEEEKSSAEDEAQKIEDGAHGADVVTEDPKEGQDASGSPDDDKPYTTIKVGVAIDLVALGLYVGGTRDASLATVQVMGVWALYKANNVEESVVMASLERLSLKDEREGTDVEMQYMIGLADDTASNNLEGDFSHAQRMKKEKKGTDSDVASASSIRGWGSGLTMLVVDAKLSPTQQQVSLRIQRPRVVVAFDFLLAVGEFFVPSMHGMLADKGEENPLDMKNGMFLNDHVYKQTEKEIRISPKKPLVADNEGVQEYIYNGQGNTLRLLNRNDEDLSMLSPEALIFVGDGKRLIFRNVIIQNGDYLDSSIYLGSNSSYSASRDDGVFLEGPPEESDTSSKTSREEDKKDQKKEDGNKPPVEMVFDLQAIGPELCLYDSINRPHGLVLPERHLLAKMNAFARFSMKGEDMELTANLNGFTVESTSGMNVLEPFDAFVNYSKVTGKQSIHARVTEFYTNFSFSILQLILRLQDDVMSVMRITSEQITVECSEFEKIWADDDSEVAAGGSHLAFWRPRPLPGFAVLGDCVTPLDEPPAKGVLTVNMALVRGKRPTGYKREWSSFELGSAKKLNENGKELSESSSKQELDNALISISDDEEGEPRGCCIWLPIAPEGYVALGCVVWKGQEEPPKSAALCVLAALISPSSMRDCINIQGTTSMDSQKKWAFWRADNSIGTFFLQTDIKEHVQPKAYDLRLAISNYGMFTVEETVPADPARESRLSQTLSTIREEEPDTAGLLTAVVSSGRIYENVGRFKLVWWDKGSGSGDGISIWRPFVPAGCAMVGDIAVKGYEPPSTGLVLRDTEEGGLISKAERFQELGHISKQRHLDGVYFWIPVAPPGYSVLGCIAGKSSSPDKDVMESIRCVRNDLVSSANFVDSSLWSTKALKSRQQQLSIWPVENEANTFFVKPGSFESPSPNSALGLADLRRQSQPDNLTVAVEVKSVSATIYDDFGGFMTPLLDLSITGIQASMHGRMEAFSTGVNFALTATTFNSKFDVWEPLIEPCDAFVRYEYNSDPQDKVRPTVSRVHVNTQSDFNVNVSVANANMLLEAYSSWMNLSKLEARNKKQDDSGSSQNLSRRLSRLGTDMSMEGKGNKNSIILAHNEIGEQLWVRTADGGGRYQVSALPHDGTVTIKLPVNRSIQDTTHNEMTQGRSGKFVAIRIGDAEIPQDQGVGGREYMAAIRIVPVNAATDSKQLQFQSARTRCVNPSKDTGKQVLVVWDEVFVFEVKAREVNRVEVVVTDLARGAPVGYCTCELADGAKHGSGTDIAGSSSLELQSQNLFSPRTEEDDGYLHGEGGEIGQIMLAAHFFTVYGEGSDDDDSEELESQKNDGSQNLSAIEVSGSKNGPWSVVRLNYGLGPAPWHCGRDHLASEMFVNDGVKHLFIRTLVTLTNETEHQLEARLCPDFLVGQDTEGTASDAVNNREDLVEEEIYENQRNESGKGWRDPTSPSDPGRWCSRDLSGSSKEFPQFPLPEGWVWRTDWRLDRSGAVDPDGWAYAHDFHMLKGWPPTTGSNYEKGSMFVRRRRWIRSRQRKDSTRNLLISLGTLEPHVTVACPIESLRTGGLDYVVQVKPRAGSLSPGVAHSWSSTCKGKPETRQISNGPSKELRIRGLQNTEQLLSCSVLASSSDTSEKDVWLCLQSKATEVGKSSQMKPIQDWHLTVSAPLELTNFLPVPCKYTVSEKANGKGLVELQSGVVKPGKSKAVFLADLRKALYLRWIPEGGWQHQGEDALISQPGKDPAKGVVVTNGVRDLAIHMQYGNGSNDLSARVIQFYVPCWLDSVGCPSLKYKLVGGGKKQKGDRSWFSKKSLEEVDEEDMHQYPTMISNFDCKTMKLAVALSGSESTTFGPAEPLSALDDPDGNVDLRVVDQNNSHFRFLITTTSHSDGFAQTQVVRLRPYTLFTNRLGLPLELRQAGVDHSNTLQPWDWRTTFAFPEVQEFLQLQIRLEGSEWSLPFAIKKEGVMDIVVRHASGHRQYVRLDVRGYDDGSRFVAIFQLGSGRGPYRVENRTGQVRIKFRQVGLDESAWRSIRPHSSATFAWENLLGEKLLEVMQEGRDASQTVQIDPDRIGDHPMISGDKTSGFNICVRVLDAPAAKVVRFFDSEVEIQPKDDSGGDEIEQTAPSQGATQPMHDVQERRPEAPSQMEISVGVGRLGLSVIDQTPRELIFFVTEKVDLVYATGLGENVSRFTATVGYLQVDNTLPLTPMPVLLAPEIHEVEGNVIKATASMKADTGEAAQVYPYIGLQLTKAAFRINAHEALIWAFLEMYNNLHLDRLSSDSPVVSVDPEITIETLDMSELRFKVSVETSPDQRPQGKLGIWGPAVTTLGNITKMPINFRPVFRENRRMRKSQVQAQILNRVKRDIIHQPLQLLTGVNVIGMTSSTLGTMSRGAASLSKDDDFVRVRTNQETARKVTGVGDGVVQGTTSFARGVGYGVKGIVTKPIDGAQDGGAAGCIQGVFKAFVGVVVEPLSGCLDFMALSVSGIGTSCSNCFEAFEHDQKCDRYRLPRAIKGDGVLTPYDPHAARGQAILQLAQGNDDVFRTSGAFAFSDFYQNHFYLPDNRILMLTNQRVLMLLSPSSHARDKRKELKEPCTTEWEMQWTNMLTVEEADGNTQVLLHLRHSSTQFTQVVSCNPPNGSETPQATEIYRAVQQQWRAICPTPEDPSKPKKARRFRRNKSRPVHETGKSGRSSQATGSNRSLIEDAADISGSSGRRWEVPPNDDDFRTTTSLDMLIWNGGKADGSCMGSTAGATISFWRPVAPPGYVSVGDVAYVGSDPESQSVIVYRYDEDRFEKPVGYDLVWRNWKDGSGSPVSIWMPKAPEGYEALGCVVCADYQEPDLDVAWCVIRDLTEEVSTVEDTPVWEAPGESPWRCFVYPVATEAKSFIALREEKNEHTPKPRKVRAAH
ncbi:hypothetical protein M758_10G145000 [Ceratodon purpureus]|nr:hypothetical protein M758_10G145000 [Ceratodon purpureus]